jgi:hypothetical protein
MREMVRSYERAWASLLRVSECLGYC